MHTREDDRGSERMRERKGERVCACVTERHTKKARKRDREREVEKERERYTYREREIQYGRNRDEGK